MNVSSLRMNKYYLRGFLQFRCNQRWGRKKKENWDFFQLSAQTNRRLAKEQKGENCLIRRMMIALGNSTPSKRERFISVSVKFFECFLAAGFSSYRVVRQTSVSLTEPTDRQ